MSVRMGEQRRLIDGNLVAPAGGAGIESLAMFTETTTVGRPA